MSDNILILSGSPRKGSNTDQLVDAFIKGAEGSGKTVTLFRVAEMKIGGCLGCCYCFSHDGKCVLKDDMSQISEALRYADTVVLASPIYFANVSSQLKAAIDRTYANKSAMPPKQVIIMGGKPDPWKKGALLLTCASPNTEIAESAIVMYKAFVNHGGREDGGVIVAGGINEWGAIAGKPVLKQAEKLGREI